MTAMLSLPEAQNLLAELLPLPPIEQPISQAVSAVLAQSVHAQVPLPHASTSAMDGWALATPVQHPDDGDPHWRVRDDGAEHPGTPLPALHTGEAIGVVTGSPIPDGALSVLRSEHSRLEAGQLCATEGTPDLEGGRNIRPAGIEAERGAQLLSAGEVLTPVRTAVAAVAGYDTLRVHPAPQVEIIATGSEVVTAGLPVPGQVRDTFTLSLPAMVAELGAEVAGVCRAEDDVDPLVETFSATQADLILTTGGTAHSRADTVRPALEKCGAEILLDSVDMRPGHPALCARLPSGTLVLGLPGNPLAGFAALTVLGGPLLGALRAVADPMGSRVVTARAGEDFAAARRGHRLLPVASTGGRVYSVGFSKPHMMRGLAHSEAFAVVPPGGIPAGSQVQCHPVPGQHQLGGLSIGGASIDPGATQASRRR